MSKKKLNFTLLVHSLFCSFILIGFLSGCSQNRMDFYENTDTTDLSKENIGGIKIGSIEKDVMNVFGKPDSIHRSQEPDTYYLIYGKNEDVQFKIVDGVVKEYFFSDQKLTTEKGISIGDSKADVIENYGKNYYTRTDTGEKDNVLGYFDKENNIVLEFIFEKNLAVILSTYNGSSNH